MSACNCVGGSCESCQLERASRAGGDQGLSAQEIEIQRLRAELATVKSQRDMAVAALQVERTESRRAFERTRLAMRSLKLNGGVA